MALPDNTQDYENVSQGIDRITDILRQQSTPVQSSPFQPQASQLPMNILNAINYSGRNYASQMSNSNFAKDVQGYETNQQNQQLAQQESILKTYEMKLKMGDAKTKALDSRIKMFVGDDPQATAIILEELHNDPESIDPTNAFQTSSKIAGIVKRNGLQNVERDLALAEKQSDIDYKTYLSLRAISGGSGATNKPPSGYRYLPDGQSLEPIPGGPGEKMSAEISARVGLANKFLGQAADIKEAVKRGVATGAVDYAKGSIGRGESGKISRRIEDGADALQRMLTGAGMPASEAADYTRRFRVGKLDDAAILLDKVENLEDNLTAQIEVAMRGHGTLNPEDATPDAILDLPDPSQHSGRSITDTDTGQKYISNGSEWVPQ